MRSTSPLSPNEEWQINRLRDKTKEAHVNMTFVEDKNYTMSSLYNIDSTSSPT